MSTQHPTLYAVIETRETAAPFFWEAATTRYEAEAFTKLDPPIPNASVVPYVPASALDDLRAEVEALRRERDEYQQAGVTVVESADQMRAEWVDIEAALTARAEKAEAERDAAVSWREDLPGIIADMRGVDRDDVCPTCQATGVRAYSNTSAWRGGAGGQMITTATCDVCWGSGSKSRPGPNLRALTALTARAEKAEAERDAWKAKAEAAEKELTEAERWGRDLLSKAEKRRRKTVVPAGLRVGMRVLYAPTVGGKAYTGVVAGEPRTIGGTETVRLEEMDPAYGRDTGRPERTTVAAAAITNIFIEADE